MGAGEQSPKPGKCVREAEETRASLELPSGSRLHSLPLVNADITDSYKSAALTGFEFFLFCFILLF